MSRQAAHELNQACFCVGVDRGALTSAMMDAADDGEILVRLIADRSHLISSSPVFLSQADAAAMANVAAAVEAAVQLPAFRAAALSHAPAIAFANPGPLGLFMGYDFHLTEEGPKLIEINTNAGGAFLNAFVARSQRACCGLAAAAAAFTPLAERFDAAVAASFETEWRLQRGVGRPQRVAIVDDAPHEQYLYPEFLLAQRLLQNAGFDVVIADAAELEFDGAALLHHGRAIDFVYNRLVDFPLEAPAHRALHDAYVAGAAAVSPNPHNHALHADKRNLLLLSDAAKLAEYGLAAEHIAHLRAVPRALAVSADNADALWAARSSYFFKPASGYGGKAVYRGDKLTKSVWERVRAGGYIAQQFAAPNERVVQVGGERQVCKVDVRLYAYAGQPLLMAARLYQGQTTNFRTPGGGFAPVLIV